MLLFSLKTCVRYVTACQTFSMSLKNACQLAINSPNIQYTPPFRNGINLLLFRETFTCQSMISCIGSLSDSNKYS